MQFDDTELMTHLGTSKSETMAESLSLPTKNWEGSSRLPQVYSRCLFREHTRRPSFSEISAVLMPVVMQQRIDDAAPLSKEWNGTAKMDPIRASPSTSSTNDVLLAPNDQATKLQGDRAKLTDSIASDITKSTSMHGESSGSFWDSDKESSTNIESASSRRLTLRANDPPSNDEYLDIEDEPISRI